MPRGGDLSISGLQAYPDQDLDHLRPPGGDCLLGTGQRPDGEVGSLDPNDRLLERSVSGEGRGVGRLVLPSEKGGVPGFGGPLFTPSGTGSEPPFRAHPRGALAVAARPFNALAASKLLLRWPVSFKKLANAIRVAGDLPGMVSKAADIGRRVNREDGACRRTNEAKISLGAETGTASSPPVLTAGWEERARSGGRR